MVVEITGSLDKHGMVIDFFDLNKIIKPIIEKYDHAFLCWENDKNLRGFLEKSKMKRVIVGYHSTVENICNDFLHKISNKLNRIKNNNFEEITVKIFESPNSFAELTKIIGKDIAL